MKIALYIEDGLEQIVLTPETAIEASILEKLDDDTREMSIKRGSFYACNGGWTRYTAASISPYAQGKRQDDKSTMIVLRAKVSDGQGLGGANNPAQEAA